MNAARKAWIVAASIGAVESLKDQGICRWNYTIRSLQQHAKNNIRSFAQANINSSSGSSTTATATMSNEIITNNVNLMKKEASMEKVMGLSCWGPSTIRF